MFIKFIFLEIIFIIFNSAWASKTARRGTLNTQNYSTSGRSDLQHVNREKRSHPVFKDPKDISRADARKYFQDYYRCLNKKNRREEKEGDYIHAVIAQEGQDIILQCHLCLRPDRHINSYNILWKRLDQSDGQDEVIDTDKGDKYVLTEGKGLRITQIDVGDSGQFFCLQHGEYEAIYQVDVLLREKRRVIMDTSETKKPLPEVHLVDRNIRIVTIWSKWTECNKCNEVGLRRKIGICTIKKIDKKKPLVPAAPVFKYYPDGVPCRSTVLPPAMARLTQIKYRRSETILGECFIPCPTVGTIRAVTDKTGKVIRKVEVQYYSLKDKPTLPPKVKRKVKYKDAGKRFILKCPTKKPVKNIRWQNGTEAINRLTIRRKSRGRVRVDSGNRLAIRRLKILDTAVYSCWIRDELIATFKIVVTKKFNKNIKRYISYGGCGLTIVAVIVLGVSLCKSSEKKTLK